MLVQPILKDMNVEDLNQRYINSFINYGGEVVYVDGFFTSDTTRFYYKKVIHGVTQEQEEVIFHWELLNGLRPVSRWYKGRMDFYAYVFPILKKQYTRGVNVDNYSFSILEDHRRSINLIIEAVLDERNQNLDWKSVFSIDDIWSSYGTVILTPQIIVMGGSKSIYYRSMRVGKVVDKKNIILEKGFILEELKECIINATIDMEGPNEDTQNKQSEDAGF